MRRLLLLLLATSALAIAAACVAPEEEVPPNAAGSTAASTPGPLSPTPLPTPPAATPAPAVTPGPGVTLWRWVNVTVVIPEGSGIVAGPGAGGTVSPGGTLPFRIDKKDPVDARVSSYVLIDAENGSVLSEYVLAEHKAAIDGVMASLRVGPLDTAAAPWPYKADAPPDVAREQFMAFSVVEPSPSTGLYIYGGLADPGGVFVALANGRSAAFVEVDPLTGELRKDTASVSPEDLAAFQRWLATVEVCGTNVAC